jgi:hypothetical protein
VKERATYDIVEDGQVRQKRVVLITGMREILWCGVTTVSLEPLQKL